MKIQAIQNFRDELLKKVNDYEQECLAKIKDKDHFSFCKNLVESSLANTIRIYDEWHDSLEIIESSDHADKILSNL